MMDTQEIGMELMRADAALAAIPNIVSIYGSARLPEQCAECVLTEQLARRLSAMGFSVMSGGGLGIMGAANKGAQGEKGRSIGLNIALPHEQKPNGFQDVSLRFESFAARKAVFLHYSVAHVVMAGGFGTLDELTECLTHVQTGKLLPCPIILVGSVFWAGLVDWIRAQLVPRGLIKASDVDLFYVTDSIDEVVDVISRHVKGR